MSKEKKANWDTAIQDAEQMIKYLRARIRELKLAIRVFKKNRDGGEPFPELSTEKTKKVTDNPNDNS